jgi:hypothetical protein
VLRGPLNEFLKKGNFTFDAIVFSKHPLERAYFGLVILSEWANGRMGRCIWRMNDS